MRLRLSFHHISETTMLVTWVFSVKCSCLCKGTRRTACSELKASSNICINRSRRQTVFHTALEGLWMINSTLGHDQWLGLTCWLCQFGFMDMFTCRLYGIWSKILRLCTAFTFIFNTSLFEYQASLVWFLNKWRYLEIQNQQQQQQVLPAAPYWTHSGALTWISKLWNCWFCLSH